MKKVIAIILAAVLAVFVESWSSPVEQVASAAARGHSGGGHGAGPGGGLRGGGGFRGGGHGGGHHGGGHFSGGVWFGPGWWDPFYYPYYPYYPYYTQPSVVIQQPEEYILPEPQPQETGYWYFCKEAKGYYPYVKSCPGGWMKVVPKPAPSDEEE
jgi:hypothetical protein